ncbi:MAG: ABC transporter permease [Flavicella sp.]|nr:ABC transporter permease [Flavicella sp.]
MFEKDLWNEIFQSIRKNKLRSMLSGFTIAFAILIFTLLFGMANGLKNTFESFFLDEASNLIYIRSGKTSLPYKGNQTDKKINFSNKDYEHVKSHYQEKIEFITARIFKKFTTAYKGNKDNYSIRAVHPDHQYLENTNVTFGRFLNVADLQDKLKYVVIGRLVAKDLFENKNPIGKYLSLQGVSFKVVGVFEDSGGDNEERIIYMPVSTAQSTFSDNDYVNEINLTYKPKMNFEQAIAFSVLLEKELKERFSVAPKDQRAIRIRNTADSMKKTNQMLFVLGVLILFIGFGTLIAGVVGISNILVYIVKERTKELGIRKVLGAEPKSIVGMILLESILITIVAGYVGMFLGVSALQLIGNRLTDYFITDPSVDHGIVIGATLVLILSGAVAGYVPAKKAAKIKPIVALRNE